jgi:hypothetical protein
VFTVVLPVPPNHGECGAGEDENVAIGGRPPKVSSSSEMGWLFLARNGRGGLGFSASLAEKARTDWLGELTGVGASISFVTNGG